MEFQLPERPLLKVFSYLDAFSLLQVCQVNKYWNSVAESNHLWRNLCQKKWDFAYWSLQVPMWKEFFLNQMKHEYRMALAEPEDFVFKEGTGNIGILGHMAYLSEGFEPVSGEEKSLVCTVSSKRMLYIWDVQEEVVPNAVHLQGAQRLSFLSEPEGVVREALERGLADSKWVPNYCVILGVRIWTSPVQPSSIKLLVTIPQLQLAFTVDVEESVKAWHHHHGDALATRTMPRVTFSLEAFTINDSPFLMVGNSEGDIYTLAAPELRNISIVNAFNHSVDLLHCSPDQKWVFAAGTYQQVWPQVLLVECLLTPPAGRAPLSVFLQVRECWAAGWAPKRANRITIMFRKSPANKTGFITFDITTERVGDQAVIKEHWVASFMLSAHLESPTRMGVGDGNVIVFDSGPQLLLFTIHGELLQQFHNHELTICHLWVDPFYVLTTSMDNYLHLYMWEEKGHHAYLKSCCHLEHRSYDYTPSCFLSQAICDKRSIVCVVSKNRESSILVMYSLDTNCGNVCN